MPSSKGKSGKPAQAKTADNRRRFDRRDTQIIAELDHEGKLVKGTVTNLSLAGCLFAPQVDIPVGARIKLKLSGETPVAATVKGVSGQGVHCMLHAGGVTLGRLSTDLDDMALLMLNAARPHEIAPLVAAAPAPAVPAKKKPAVKKAVKKKAAKKAVKKPATKKTAKKVVKKVVKKKVVKKKTAGRKR